MNYDEAKSRFEESSREEVKLENNTVLHKPEAYTYAIRLHDTDILTFEPSGMVTIRTGGWDTDTTKRRINKYAPVNIVQRDHDWIVTGASRSVVWAFADSEKSFLIVGENGVIHRQYDEFARGVA